MQTSNAINGHVSIEVINRNGKIRHQHRGSNQILDVGVDYILDIIAGSGNTGGLVSYEIAFGDSGVPSTSDMTAIDGVEAGVIHTILAPIGTPLNFTQKNVCQFHNFSSSPGSINNGVLSQVSGDSVDVSGYFWNMFCRGRANDFLDPSSPFLQEAVLFFHANNGAPIRVAFARAVFSRFQIFTGDDLRFNWYLEFGNSPANWVQQFEQEYYGYDFS